MLANAVVAASLPCVDLEKARTFYGQTLGLNEIEMPGVPEAQPAALYQGGQGSMLLVYQRETPTQADHTAAAWMVEDIDATVDFLVSRGVKFEVYDIPDVEWDDRGVASMGELRTAWFTDPEGNILAINQMP